MSDNLQPYPDYKQADVPWLDTIPANWSVLRAKNLFRIIDVRSETGNEELLTVSSSDGVVPRSQKAVTMFKAESYVGHKLCWPQDLVINSLWAWMQGLGFSRYHGLVSSAYSVYRLKSEFVGNWRYFHYLLRSAIYRWELQIRSKGVWLSRLQLSDTAFLDMPIIVPSAEDAAAIVHYLDHADRRIRRYIRTKQTLIKLLNEQKQIIIQQAVTGGLNPDAPRKDSGVEWLGEVPAHWEIVALRHRYSSELGKMLDAKRITGHYLIPYVRNINVQWDRINMANLAQMDIEPREYPRYTIQKGDLLVCEGGEVGRCAIWNDDLALCGFQKAIHRLRPVDVSRDNTRFLYYSMYLAAKLGIFLADGSENTIAHLTGVKLRRHRFAFPSRSEQDAIVAYLDNSVAKIDFSVKKIQYEIDLMREYRTRLITDVVTGKLDVRAVAAQLPDETDEPDVIDEIDDRIEEDDDLSELSEETSEE